VVGAAAAASNLHWGLLLTLPEWRILSACAVSHAGCVHQQDSVGRMWEAAARGVKAYLLGMRMWRTQHAPAVTWWPAQRTVHRVCRLAEARAASQAAACLMLRPQWCVHVLMLPQVIDASNGEPLDFGAIYKVGTQHKHCSETALDCTIREAGRDIDACFTYIACCLYNTANSLTCNWPAHRISVRFEYHTECSPGAVCDSTTRPCCLLCSTQHVQLYDRCSICQDDTASDC
jgi:hypothetical protein